MVVVVIATTVCTAAMLVHAPFFRAEMLVLAERMLERSIRGEVSFGRLEGILLHRATLRDVQVRDREGRTVLEADIVRVDPDLFSLIFDGVLRFDNVQLVGPRVHLATDEEGRLNLSELFAPKKPREPKGPARFTPIAIDVVNARVLDGFVSYEPHRGAKQIAGDIDLRGDARIRSDRIDASIGELSLSPSAYPSRIALSGRATIEPKRITVAALRIADRFGSSGRVFDATHDLMTGATRARIELAIDSASLRALTGIRGLRGSAYLEGRLLHDHAVAPWSIDAEGRINRAPLALEASAAPDFGKISAELKLRGPLDPSQIHASAPSGPLSGRIAVSLEDSRIEQLTGALSVDLSGRLQQGKDAPAIELSRFAVDGSAKRGELEASGTIDSDRATASFDMQGNLRTGALELSPLSIDLEVRELAAVLPPGTNVFGALALKGGASGTLDRLRVRAEVRGRRLRAGKTKLGDADARIAGAMNDLWRIELESRGAQHVEHASVIARAEIGEKRARVQFDELSLSALGEDWIATSKPYLEAVSRRRGWLVDARDVNLESRSGSIALNGRADLGRKRIERLNLVATDVDLPALQDALAIEPKVRGTVDADVEVRDDRRITGTVSLSQNDRRVITAKLDLTTPGIARLARAEGKVEAAIDAFSLSSVKTERTITGTVSAEATLVRKKKRIDLDLRGAASDLRWHPRVPAMQVSLDARMHDRGIELAGWIAGAIARRIDVKLSASPPDDLLSPHAWRTLGPAAVRSARLVASKTDLSAWTNLAGTPPMSGTVSATVAIGEQARRVEGYVTLDRFQSPRMSRAIDGVATIDSSSGSTRMTAELFDRRWPILLLEASVPRDVVGLANTSTIALVKLPLEGTIRSSRLPLSLLASLIGARDVAKGSISIDGRLSGSIADPLFDVRIASDDATIASAAFRKIDARAALSREKLSSTARMEQRRGGRLELDADLGLGTDRAIDARLAANAFDLGFLSLLAPETRGTLGGVAGKLNADIALSGTRDDPALEGEVKIEGLRAILKHPIPPLENTTVDLRFKKEKVIFGIEGRSGDGTFLITGNGELPSLDRPDLAGEIEVENLSIAAGPRLVETDLEAKWYLRSQPDRIEGEVVIVEGSSEMETGAADLAPVRRFDDVVLVERLGEEDRRTPAKETKKKIEVAAPKTQFLLRVRTEDPIPIRSDDLNASVSVDLVMETSSEGLIGRGGISLTDGTVTLFGGRQWFIERAEIQFSGEPDEEPTLGVRIFHDFTDVVVYVDVLGTPSNPEIQLTSDPGTFTREQLLGFVLGGSPEGSLADAELGERATGVAAGFLVGQIQNIVEDRLPIDTLSVDLEEGARASAVLIGKWITDRLFLAYNYRIEPDPDENSSEGIVRVLFGGGWILEAVYGDRGNGAADILWIKRF